MEHYEDPRAAAADHELDERKDRDHPLHRRKDRTMKPRKWFAASYFPDNILPRMGALFIDGDGLEWRVITGGSTDLQEVLAFCETPLCQREGCELTENVHGHGETGREDSHPFEPPAEDLLERTSPVDELNERAAQLDPTIIRCGLCDGELRAEVEKEHGYHRACKALPLGEDDVERARRLAGGEEKETHVAGPWHRYLCTACWKSDFVREERTRDPERCRHCQGWKMKHYLADVIDDPFLSVLEEHGLAMPKKIEGDVRSFQVAGELVESMGARRGRDWRDRLKEYYARTEWPSSVDRLAQLLVDLRRAGVDVEQAWAEAYPDILKRRDVPLGGAMYRQEKRSNDERDTATEAGTSEPAHRPDGSAGA